MERKGWREKGSSGETNGVERRGKKKGRWKLCKKEKGLNERKNKHGKIIKI